MNEKSRKGSGQEIQESVFEKAIFWEQDEVESEELLSHVGQIVKVHGSIYKIRKMSGFAFVLLRTKREVIQCIYTEEEANFSLEELKENACVRFEGRVVAEERARKGYDFHLLSVTILSNPTEEMPVVINGKIMNANLETLLDYRPITLRNESMRAIFKLQEGVCQGFRQFLQEQRFTEIHSPKLVSAGAEGGANIFGLKYFDRQAYLAQSPQFYKQMMVGVYERVFEIGPVFRAEKHDTSRHLNEYTGVDFEMGYVTKIEQLMAMETGMIQAAMKHLEENYEPELNLLKVELPVVTRIPVIPFHEAKEIVKETYHREIKDYEDFEPEEEKLLSEYVKKEYESEFVFVSCYPTAKRPFYAMEEKDNPEITQSFDLFFRGIEVTTGGLRIHDYEEQVAKMIRKGLRPEDFESYLMMHKYGMPPHGGLGIGLERFTMKLLNLNNVRYTSLFPRDVHRLTP